MAKTLKVYKKDTGEVVASKELTDGTSKITLTGLTADTTYKAGTYQVSFTTEAGESQKVDVPEFKTIASGIGV